MTKILFHVSILYHVGMEDRCVAIGRHFGPLLFNHMALHRSGQLLVGIGHVEYKIARPYCNIRDARTNLPQHAIG